MKAVFWLAWRELLGRKGAFLTGSAVVAVVVSFCVGAELIGRAKGQAVRTELDRMGPALRLIPAGKTASDLARFELAAAGFDRETVAAIRAEISSLSRTLDGRLLVRESIGGQATPVIGVDPAGSFSIHEALSELGEGSVVLGAELARKLGCKLGEELVLGERRLRIVGILEVMARVEDLAAFVSLESLQNSLRRPGTLNLVDVYPRQGVELQEVVARLGPLRTQVNALVTDQDGSAIREMEQGLEQHRRALYIVTALMIVICIAIWSYLNAAERRTEVALLVALGSSTGMVLLMLAIQAAIVGSAGALLGYGVGVVAALAQDFDSARGIVVSLQLLLAMEAGVVVTCVVGSIPAALVAGFQQHASVLQET